MFYVPLNETNQLNDLKYCDPTLIILELDINISSHLIVYKQII